MNKPATYGKRPSFQEWCQHTNKYQARLHWKSVRGIVRAYIRNEEWK
jgi:hypothetical protein